MPGGGPQSAVDGEDEAGKLPTRRPPTPSRGQVPGGGPQGAVDGADEAGELPAHRRLDVLMHYSLEHKVLDEGHELGYKNKSLTSP